MPPGAVGVDLVGSELIEALGRVAGSNVPALIDEVHDPDIAAIVHTWPQDFSPDLALGLGFRGDASIDAIIETHIAQTQG